VRAIAAVRAIADGGKSDGTAQSRRLRVVRRAISRALAGANAFARPRADLRSFAFPSMVMDLPKEVPKSASSPQHQVRSMRTRSTVRSDKLSAGFELLWRFSGDIQYGNRVPFCPVMTRGLLEFYGRK